MATGITCISGIRVGHWTDREAATGCTAILCEQAVAVGVDVRGASPGTRETDVLRPGSLVGRAHAILLTGGSAFGLDAATGVMRFLEEQGVGVATRAGNVPIVSAAVLYDLQVGRADVRPDAAAGYIACQAASADSVDEGCVGAGTGATVAKRFGLDGATKGGIGTASRALDGGVVVGAIVAVNAVGAIYDPDTGQAVARPRVHKAHSEVLVGENTTIGVVATNVRLDTAGARRLAMLGHDGLAMAIRPTHTQFDGDTLFGVSMPGEYQEPVDMVALGEAAALVVAEAILRGVQAATTLHGIPSASS